MPALIRVVVAITLAGTVAVPFVPETGAAAFLTPAGLAGTQNSQIGAGGQKINGGKELGKKLGRAGNASKSNTSQNKGAQNVTKGASKSKASGGSSATQKKGNAPQNRNGH